MSAIDSTTIENALQSWVSATSGIPGSRVIWSYQDDDRPSNPWISLLLTDVVRSGLGWVDVEPNPFSFADKTYTADATTDQLASTAHGLSTGDGPFRVTSTGTPPGGLAVGIDYWAVKVDADHVKAASSFQNAVAASPVTIDITSAGTGTQKIVSTAATVRAGQEILQVVRCNYSAHLSVQCYADAPTGPQNPVAILLNVAASSLLPSIRDGLEAAGVGITDVGQVRAVGEVINTAGFEPRAQMDVTLWIVAEVSETGTIIDNVTLETTVTEEDGVTVKDATVTIP